MPPVNLDKIVDDVLHAIAMSVVRQHWTTGSTFCSIVNLAQSCRRWRSICLPIIYKRIDHSLLKLKPNGIRVWTLPPSIFAYIRILNLNLNVPDYRYLTRSRPPATIVNDACVISLPSFTSLPNVHTVIFSDAPMGIWYDLLRKVLAGPSLQSLEWRNSPWRSPEHTELATITECPPLRRISYEAHEAYKFQRAGLDFEAEELALFTILNRVSGSMEQLEMPGEISNFGKMASMDWSSLRELKLLGFAPHYESPLIVLLGSLSRLRVLDLQVPFVVWPKEFERPEGAPKLLPMLERLVLTNPSWEDCILENIPSSLMALSLIPYPKSYMSRFEGTLLSAPNLAMEAVKVVRILTTNSLASLSILQLSVHGSLEISLFRAIADACPRLEILEIFRRRTPMQVPQNESCSAIGMALRPLNSLRIARIAFDFSDAPNRSRAPARSFNSYAHKEFWEQCLDRARDFAINAGPALEELSFSRRRGDSAFWFSYDVQRECSGEVLGVMGRDGEYEYS